jgi:peroxiredoxin
MTAPITPTAIRLIPGQLVPALEVETLSETRWNLSIQVPRTFTMIVFYRGLHCPLCMEYLQELERKLEQFNAIGIECIGISGDTYERAIESRENWGLQKLQIGYGLTREAMQQWGLYISKGELAEEPPLFNEPGLFLVKPNGILFFAGVNNAPYGRPALDTLLSGLDYVLNHSYPLRGTEA